MSKETLQGIEEAIRAHFQSTIDEEDASPERRSAVMVDWVVGYTISNIVDIDGETIVGYHNEYAAGDGNPNALSHLAGWVSDEIADILREDEE